MIELNGKKFAESEQEFISSLFEKGGTCAGYAKRNKESVTLNNIQREKIGVINKHGVLCKATKLEGGKWWYSHGTINEVGEYADYMRSVEEPRKIIEQSKPFVVWVGGAYDRCHTLKQAEKRAEYWREQGYDEIQIEEEGK
jgi:hypothetical protein